MSVQIAVLGPGGVGGFVAAALARAGASEVTVVARAQTADELRRTGLAVDSRVLGPFTASPDVVTELRDAPDVLIVATKANGLADALMRIRAEPALVVPLLNGVDHLAVLRERFGSERVPAAVIRIESDRPQPGVIVQTSPAARIDLSGSDGPAAELLRGAGFDVRTGGAEADVMWSKLARLCALALTTTASDRPIGFVRSDPRWRSALENAVAETVRVAVAEGARLDPADTLAELDGAHPELGSSMQRDVDAGREPELDAIAGAVLRAGERHGLRCPTVGWLAGRVAERYSGGRTGSGADGAST
jgi:2-dehydropantoate 2-reductase